MATTGMRSYYLRPCELRVGDGLRHTPVLISETLAKEGSMTKTRKARTAFVIAFAIGLGLAASACNTVEGIGKDISSVGRAMGSDSNK